MEYVARSLPDKDPSLWQPLEDHLLQVSRLAETFSDAFSAGLWGKVLGLAHDFGKYSSAFQRYIYTANDLTHPELGDHRREDKQHAIHGARLIMDHAPPWVREFMAYCLAGHHRGLPDWHNSSDGAYLERYLDASYELPLIAPDIDPDWLRSVEFPSGGKSPITLPANPDRNNFAFMFFIRMLFSCLVDADWLDSEAFSDPDKAGHRGQYPSLVELQTRFDCYYNELTSGAQPSDLNDARRAMYEHCIAGAELEPGLFSLTMPTGGGKTLASLGFALRHALKHGFQRIFFVIPFTSIIEQNARVFRDALGADAVLEHHCNFVADRDDHRSKLASENWDAPLVVTTNVQLFDSLFANRTSKTRKIHNLAGSVIILDEAQALPAEKLRPCLAALDELARNYNCSIVLCTATQPALTRQDGFTDGLENVREIIPDAKRYFRDLKRTRVVVEQEPVDDDTLALRIAGNEQALVIVNTRRHAQNLYGKLRSREGTFHLSALMTPRHRTFTIRKIRRRLKNNLPCRVISTQLIEAGVDIDFPIVYRALAGLDSIAQAAGRCNREGLRPCTETIVFIPQDVKPPRYFVQMINVTKEILPDHAEDLLSPDAIRAFFSGYYWLQGEKLDEKNILGLCQAASNTKYPFEEIGRKFALIDQQGEVLIVPLGRRGRAFVDQWGESGPKRDLMRQLQQYSITLYDQEIKTLLDRGDILPLASYGGGGRLDEFKGPYVLHNMRLYDCDRGFMIDGPEEGEEDSNAAGVESPLIT